MTGRLDGVRAESHALRARAVLALAPPRTRVHTRQVDGCCDPRGCDGVFGDRFARRAARRYRRRGWAAPSNGWSTPPCRGASRAPPCSRSVAGWAASPGAAARRRRARHQPRARRGVRRTRPGARLRGRPGWTHRAAHPGHRGGTAGGGPCRRGRPAPGGVLLPRRRPAARRRGRPRQASARVQPPAAPPRHPGLLPRPERGIRSVREAVPKLRPLPAGMLETLGRHGLQPVYEHRGLAWHVVALERVVGS